MIYDCFITSNFVIQISTELNPDTGKLKITTTSLSDNSTQTINITDVYGPSTKNVASSNTILVQSSV